ncbi:MAG: response regulator, partial [Acidobacteriota bacterium]|nr:response regulator [Acidobacteriota bacterium]
MEPILVVDDTPTNRKLTQRVLAAAGYDVRAVGDARAALHAIAEFRPRLVLTDLRLNGMDGLALTRRIKEDPAWRGIAVIVVTGCDTEEDRRAAAHAGCDDYIVKPIDTRALPAKIEELLARRREPVLADDPMPAPADLPAWATPLCREFLAEGRSRCAALLAEHAGAPEIRAAAHVWAGLGGTFGYPEISTLARRVHDHLRRGGLPDGELTGWLERLHALFQQAAETTAGDGRHSLPQELAARLAGRRIALAGLDAAVASRFAAALADAGAEVLDTVRAGCDLAIAAANGTGPGLRELAAAGLRLLLVGTPPDGGGALPAGAHYDFVASPWTDAEVLSRACHLLARPDAAPPVNAGGAGPCKVVIADDDPTILTLLKTTVENSGMDCAVAREGAEALELVRASGADAVIL